MAIANTDTQTSPNIGLLPDGVGFSPLGGCIVDVLGKNGARLTAQRSAGSMFIGWTGPDGPNQSAPYPPNAWLVIATFAFDPSRIAEILGGGIAKANIRLTVYDGDSGSPNPVYVSMFGSGNFPYARWSSQPPDYDFDGGQNLYAGFQNSTGDPVNCGFMGERTSYRLDGAFTTINTFQGFPGVFALTDANQTGSHPPPPAYMPPFPTTGWFSVPLNQLRAFYDVMLTGVLKIGVHDETPGDQYYDFRQGLAEDVLNIPFVEPTPPPPILPPISLPPAVPLPLFFNPPKRPATIQVRALDSVRDTTAGSGLANFLVDVNAVAQIIMTRLLLLEGEWFEALHEGTPLFQSLLGQPTTEQAVALILRQRILGTVFVNSVQTVAVEFNPTARAFTFIAVVETQFGVVTLSNQ
jgi:hypothetical protein